MTNKEAIEILENGEPLEDMPYDEFEKAYAVWLEALDFAIKTLKSWSQLKETIKELSENEGTGTQQEVCKFLFNLMGVLEGGSQ